MKVLVLGAGVIGVTTAYMLAKDGHDVTVIDRGEGPGLETSFANGGQVSASHSEPWASPHSLMMALKWLGRADAPLHFPLLRFDPALWAWSLRFLRNCTPERVLINMERTLRVAAYSRTKLKELNEQLDLSYDRQTKGILHVYRDEREFDRARKAAEDMVGLGLSRDARTPEQCVELEPALSKVAPELAGGFYSPDDETGDAYKFTQEICRLAEDLGAVFKFNTSITALQKNGKEISGVVTGDSILTADSYVLALGSFSPLLAKSIGLNIPLYPAKGYSLTVPATTSAPQVSLTDDENKMVFSRFGDRLRAAGTAEFDGWNSELNRSRTGLILRNTQSLLPDGGDYSKPEFWCGLRPKTPDSTPIIGAAPGLDNLFLNTGHGTLGWTMAVGAAQIISDILGGRPADISLQGLGPERYIARE